jgi:hypothetical protein
MLIVLESCEAAAAIPCLAFTNRVLLTSSKSNEYSWWCGELQNGIFVYFLVDETGICSRKYGKPTPLENRDGAFARKSCDTNHDGWVSAEEAFNYASDWTTWFARMYGVGQHPQISDNYDGQLLITQI